MNTRFLRLPFLFIMLLSLLVACGSPRSIAAPINPTANGVSSTQSQDAWTQARTNLPATVSLYQPTFVPQRFGTPQLLEARTDKTYGSIYTIVYSAPNESLAFILNMGQGALGNFPPPEQRERITIGGSQAELLSSPEAHTMEVFWQTSAGSYQIKVYSSQMTKDEIVKISESVKQQ